MISLSVSLTLGIRIGPDLTWYSNVGIKFLNMSKKRKTRKQKETALGRKINKPDQVEVGHPVYSVVAFSDRHEIKKVEKTQKREVGENIAYLKKDIYKIVTASGIIVAANILLFTLLSTGTLRLNFLGY